MSALHYLNTDLAKVFLRNVLSGLRVSSSCESWSWNTKDS